ncbi:dual specificity protein phosphatase family protein [Paenibacillus sp. IB182496]|uniref:Dual specificity protein phosphatase family protein n=1 Tax=Paenibacillus sabuli TaxID=2772509 RepID=A0A927BTQ3_9BACL|nr:dual specificity protein phosphatase family protein [Paenibacillus sabuli]MBD2845721.1 dual specificity protein phosphatase family protein [Paenibacillus sabuli]
MPGVTSRAASYQELIEGKVWLGDLSDVTALVEKEHCDIVIDLRGEKEPTGKENPQHYLLVPMFDGCENQESRIQEAVDAVEKLVHSRHKVALHCSGGLSRAGCVATALLVRFGKASTIDDAEQLLRKMRPTISIHPKLMRSLNNLYA